MDTEKLFQVAAYILSRNNNQMDYYNLITQCYIADRRAIEAVGSAITGDEYVAMERGPVLKNLYSIVKSLKDGTCGDAMWTQYFEVKDHSIRLKKTDVKYNTLSRFDESVLFDVADAFWSFSYNEMKEYSHSGVFPEYNYSGKDETIPVSSILKAVGMYGKEIDRDALIQKYFDEIAEEDRRDYELACAIEKEMEESGEDWISLEELRAELNI